MIHPRMTPSDPSSSQDAGFLDSDAETLVDVEDKSNFLMFSFEREGSPEYMLTVKIERTDVGKFTYEDCYRSVDRYHHQHAERAFRRFGSIDGNDFVLKSMSLNLRTTCEQEEGGHVTSIPVSFDLPSRRDDTLLTREISRRIKTDDRLIAPCTARGCGRLPKTLCGLGSSRNGDFMYDGNKQTLVLEAVFRDAPEMDVEPLTVYTRDIRGSYGTRLRDTSRRLLGIWWNLER